MTEAAKAARNAYIAEWRAKNRDRLNAYKRQWQKDNPDKVRAQKERYWEKIAAEGKRDGGGVPEQGQG